MIDNLQASIGLGRYAGFLSPFPELCIRLATSRIACRGARNRAPPRRSTVPRPPSSPFGVAAHESSAAPAIEAMRRSDFRHVAMQRADGESRRGEPDSERPLRLTPRLERTWEQILRMPAVRHHAFDP